jgi:chemotaxis protein CheD
VNKIRVPLATYLLAEGPEILACYGIGSCVVVVLYDQQRKLAAMAHVVLPGRGKEGKDGLSAKYSDEAIEGMLKELLRRGSSREQLMAKIAGGAQMFVFSSPPLEDPPGRRNVEAVIKKLNQEGIPVVAADVGKNFGRSVEFHPDSARMIIKTVSEGTREI